MVVSIFCPLPHAEILTLEITTLGLTVVYLGMYIFIAVFNLLDTIYPVLLEVWHH